MDNTLQSSSSQTSISFNILIFLCVFCFCFFLPGNFVWAEGQGETLSLSGVVKDISIIEGSLIVKPEEGNRQRIVFTTETLYKGVLNASEIKVKHKVRIWYVQENDLLKALKIKVMPELGC